MRQLRARPCVVLVYGKRVVQQALRLGQASLTARGPAKVGVLDVGASQPDHRRDKSWCDPQGSLKFRLCPGTAGARIFLVVSAPAQEVLIGLGIGGLVAPESDLFAFRESNLERGYHFLGDLVLELQNGVERTVELFRPKMSAIPRFDELRVDAHAIPGRLNAPLNDIVGTKFLSDLG